MQRDRKPPGVTSGTAVSRDSLRLSAPVPARASFSGVLPPRVARWPPAAPYLHPASSAAPVEGALVPCTSPAQRDAVNICLDDLKVGDPCRKIRVLFLQEGEVESGRAKQ